MKLIFYLVLALIMVLVAATLMSEGVMPDGAAVATRVEGTVLVFTREAPAGRSLTAKESVAKDDRVEVQGNSRLELRMPDGGALRLAENARISVQQLQFAQRSGTQYLQVFLHNGKAWAKATRRAEPESRVTVVTGSGLAAGKEAVFGVDAAEGAGMTVTVYEGAVLATGAAKTAVPAVGQAIPPPDARQISLPALQQVSVPAPKGVVQPRTFELKAEINDWVRWNLQRDAREGLASITIAPPSPTVAKGASLQLSAVAHYPDNVEKDITPFATWSSSAVNVAKVGPSGLAAGAELGTATIAAAIEDMSGSAALNVSRSIVSIKVSPAARAVANGAVQQFKAVARFSDRTSRDITSSVVWSSSDPNIAVIDATGRAVAGNVSGTAVISASAGARRASATLKVRRELVSITIMPENATVFPGDFQRFGAVGSYSDKTTQDLTEVVDWDSSDINIAVAEQVQPGRVQGHEAGTATISATLGKISGSATITVEPVTTN